METKPGAYPSGERFTNGPDSCADGDLQVSTVSSTAGFAALEEEWDELYENCKQATPFQSWAWLFSWWEAYGDERKYLLKIVAIRRQTDGLLVGLLPLMLERESPWRVLFVGTGLTDYLDVLVREGSEKEVGEAGRGALARLCRWRVVDLQQLRPEGAAWGVFGGWDGFGLRVWQESCPVVELKPWEELVASLSRNNRSVVRRNIKRVTGDGISRELAGVERAEEAASKLVALHREGWGGREIDAEHLSESFETCLGAAARRMTVRGIAGISEFRDSGGEVIGADFLILGRDTVGSYVQGASQTALRRYQLSSIYIWDAANLARDGGFTHFDWMRGREDYKLRWSPELIPSYRLILGRAPLLWAPYAAYHGLRSRAKAYLYSGKAPRWAVTAAKRANIAAKRLREGKLGFERALARGSKNP